MSGRKLVNPSKVRIAVWNSGNHLIQRTDFGGTSPISINFKGGELLTIELVKITRSETQTSIVKTDDNTATISLDYWNPGNGLLFDVYVDTNPDRSFNPHRDMAVVTDIRGNESPIYSVYWQFTNQTHSFRAKAVYIISLILILFAIAKQVVNLYNSGIYSVMIIPNIISTTLFVMVLLIMIMIPISDRQPKGRNFPGRLETKIEDQDIWPEHAIQELLEDHKTSAS